MTNEPFRGLNLSAALSVKDLERSLTWYRDVFGFAVTQKYERDGKLMAVSLAAGEVAILITQDDGAKGLDRKKGEGFSMQITTEQDVDELAGAIKQRGGTLDLEPSATPWGPRIFRISDPDGFKFTISSPRKPAQ
ncbi:MAG TPA: VOC family protein [Thermoanaerobaculia bacterium]|jgi:uncharacterized glyoxalase superfamily protein PhnB